MTWPFENDTSAVVKRISNRSISANRKRNLFTIITIALAAALLLAIMLYGFGTSQANINRTKDTAQIVFTNITQEQGDKLYEQNQIDWIGEFTLVSTEQVNNSTFYLQYGNAEMFDAQGMTYSGNIPVSANEIMLQKSFLKELGYGTELGQTISIPLANGQTISFILSGIINVEMGDIGSYMGMVSKEYADQQNGGTATLDYYVGLKNAENMSEEEASSIALAQVDGATEDELRINKDNDDNRNIYEVSILHDGVEYDFEIDAQTGDILSQSSERDDDDDWDDGQSGSQNNNQNNSGLISEKKASKIALGQVDGATESDLRIHQDTDDGRTVYEGSIIYNEMEYEFEIDAQSGDIIDWSSESVYDD